MLDINIRRRIDAARDVLIDQMPDPKGQVEQITTALIYKYMDDLDRRSLENGGERLYFAGDNMRFSWKTLMDARLPVHERLNLYRQAIEGMAAKDNMPNVFRGMFKGAFSSFSDGKRLDHFVREVDGVLCQDFNNLGDTYEYLLSIMDTHGSAGQFRTPRHIIDFIVSIVAPQNGEHVHDPACGTAGFLISTFNSVSQDVARRKHFPELVGYDLDEGMVRLSLVNMYLHGIEQPQINQYDTLTSEHLWDNSYDVILANPPFMSPRGGVRPHSRFSVQATRSEVLFVNYIGEHLNRDGRAGIIVPEGIIFQTRRAPRELRRRLLEEWGLWAVISLPSGIFRPYSAIKTSILFLDKPRARTCDEVLFVKIDMDGFSLGTQRQIVGENDLPEALQILEDWKDGKKRESGLATWVSKRTIAASNSYDLTIERYNSVVDTNVRWARVTLGDFIEEKTDRVKTEALPIWTISKSKGFIASEDYFQYPVHSKDTKQYKRIMPGYLAYNPMRIGVGSIALNRTKRSGMVSPMYVAFRVSNSNLDSSYLLALIKHDYMMNKIRACSHGTTRPILRLSDLVRMKIPLPPLAIQQEIVSELRSCQDFVDDAQATINSWKPDVDVDPDWPMKPLGEASEVFSGKSFKKTDYKDSGATRVLKLKDFNEQGVNFENDTNSWFDIPVAEHKLLVQGDVLVVSTAHSASHIAFKIGFLDANPPVPTFPSGEITVLRAKEGLLSGFLDGVIRTGRFRRKLKSITKGLHIYPSDIRTISIPVPEIAAQKRIVADIERERNVIFACKQLVELRIQKMHNRIAELWE